jgi:glutathione S-transferase
MTQPTLKLFHFPGACSRVAVCALEMAKLTYELELVNLAKGEQGEPHYKDISPLGKVPALMIDGEIILENGAILTFIDELRPEAGTLPADRSARMRAEAVGGMSFCGGTLHPLMRGLANPQRLTAGDGEPVREKSRELAKKSFAYAEQRLASKEWWLGELSIVDVYLDWAFSIARKFGFDISAYPILHALEGRLMGESEAYRNMQDEERRSSLKLGLLT